MAVTKPNTSRLPHPGPSNVPSAKPSGVPAGSSRTAASEWACEPGGDLEWPNFVATGSMPDPVGRGLRLRSVIPDRLLRIEEVCELLSLKSKQSVYNRLKEGGRYWDSDFPKQVYLSGSVARPSGARWYASAVYRYIAMLRKHSK